MNEGEGRKGRKQRNEWKDGGWEGGKEACMNTHEHGRCQDIQAEQVGHWGMRKKTRNRGTGSEKKRARERRDRQLSL